MFLRSIFVNSSIGIVPGFGQISGTTLLRSFSITPLRLCENVEERGGPKKPAKVRGTISRLNQIPVETSMRYLESDAYKTTYGENLVWTLYRRNHKGMYPPKKTRKTCVRGGYISTGNPCPICRDEHLVLDHRNTKLLEQFISPETGKVLSYRKTGVCQKKHTELLVAVRRAMDCGYLVHDVPFREFDYSEYYDENNNSRR